jgi:hypothetical protein
MIAPPLPPSPQSISPTTAPQAKQTHSRSQGIRSPSAAIIGASNVTTGPAITNTIDLDIILNASRSISPGNNQKIIISGVISETGTWEKLDYDW